MSVDLHRIRYQEIISIEFFDNPIELNFDNTALFHFRPVLKYRFNLESQTASLPSYWDDYFKSWPDLNEGHPEMFRRTIFIVVLSSLGYALPYYVDFPCAKSVQILALGILAAAAYDIMRDLRVCYQCIEYYSIGHSSFHKRHLKTDNPIANGLIWGSLIAQKSSSFSLIVDL